MTNHFSSLSLRLSSLCVAGKGFAFNSMQRGGRVNGKLFIGNKKRGILCTFLFHGNIAFLKET
jgi:hypothetical protein